MYRVCVVTATRAEYGLLRPLLFKLKRSTEVELQLVVTGTHLLESFGNTQKEIVKDGFIDYYVVDLPLEDDSKKGMAVATGVAAKEFALLFDRIKPELLVILGDRFEMLGVAAAAHLLGIPIAHMCGGDVTEGAVDDAIRHCITKLSYLHFPGCEQSANRIIQMGENPSRVFNVGEPGVENCLNMKFLSRDEVAGQIGFNGILDNYCMVTFHPVTMENNTTEEQVKELIKAMELFPDLSFVITMANADAGGRKINKIWKEYSLFHENWLVVNSLGVLRYLSAVKYSSLVIGNSSSGLVEAPALKVPTVNIGDRQKGRMMANSVLSCSPKASDICRAMKTGLTDEFRSIVKSTDLPFGDGTTSRQIMDIILPFLRSNRGELKKTFFELPSILRCT